MNCVSIVEYSIILNVEVLRSFKPSRGLSQGDPLSPRLFLFVADVLSRMMIREDASGNIQG